MRGIWIGIGIASIALAYQAGTGLAALCLAPDLDIGRGVLKSSIHIVQETTPECAIAEGCAGTGTRKLLKFTTRIWNFGNADLRLGRPENNPRFHYDACHQHYHYKNYAKYLLLDASGNRVVRGRKQGFCVIDLIPGPRRYHCGNQGISVNYADEYAVGIDCQWIDITGVPAGEYKLRVVVNPDRSLRELRYDNNTETVRVTIP